MTADNDMVERVAQAIYEARNGLRCKPFAHQPQSHRDPYRADALAAIKAMREPTKAMIEPGYDEIGFNIDYYNYDSGSGYTIEPAAPTNIWRAMIDAALKREGE